MQAYAKLLSPRTKIVALVHVSNMLGSLLDTSFVVEQAHKVCQTQLSQRLLGATAMLRESPETLGYSSSLPHGKNWMRRSASHMWARSGQSCSMRACGKNTFLMHRWGPRCCWIVHSLCLASLQMCKHSVQTGLWQQATRCVDPLALASFGAGKQLQQSVWLLMPSSD